MPSVSVCIPTYNKPRQVVQEAINSATAQLSPDDELIIAPQGPQAAEMVTELSLPGRAKILPSDVPPGLAENWNRCLEAARGDLIHILHDDDAAAPGFYRAVRRLATEFSDSALYVTGCREFAEGAPERQPEGVRQPLRLRGAAAAAFLLEGKLYCCGSVVLRSGETLRAGPFRETFPYCPDQEAYLRYAANGGLAFDPRPLYKERRSTAQIRHATWRRSDFVRVYATAREEGASNYGPDVSKLARDSTAIHVIGVALTLALDGASATAAVHLRELAKRYPDCSAWPRYRIAQLALGSRALLAVVRARRWARRWIHSKFHPIS